jgi:hypothetical protein
MAGRKNLGKTLAFYQYIETQSFCIFSKNKKQVAAPYMDELP